MKLEDYGLIGDLESAALVGKNGSIDWLCLPRFDSGALFAALLGDSKNGAWQIAPKGGWIKSSQAYRQDTLVLETEFTTADGVVKIIDFMPIHDGSHDVVRIVQGIRGKVPMRLDLTVRFDYGHILPWVRKQNEGISATAGGDSIQFYSDVETCGEDFSTVAEFEIGEGESETFSVSWHASETEAAARIDCHTTLENTEKFWRDWSAQCQYQGEWREQVMRSLITLKALTYWPTGGVVAAPTTSLPEKIGGVRNWDYRYCWLRDATFTLMAFLDAGYKTEANSWRSWLLRAIAGDPSELQIMYGLSGERRLDEFEIDWLPGYENSRPVHIGNAAAKQFQLDVYGEVLNALYHARLAGVDPDPYAWHVARAILSFLEKSWHEPDEGIWEVRGPRQHFTHSKVMAWVAFDRAVAAMEEYPLDGEMDRWRNIRDEIKTEICSSGYSEKLGSFTQFYGSETLDASLLILPLVGFLPATDPRIVSTVAAIEKKLLVDGFVLRYDSAGGSSCDGLPSGEGAFLPCSFWLVDCYVLLGEKEKARELFQRLLSISSPLGLLSEEYDPQAKRQVGNFPQAFSHVGLVVAALNLSNAGYDGEK